MKVGERKLSQGLVDRITEPYRRMVGFRDSAPIAVPFVECDHVVIVRVSFLV